MQRRAPPYTYLRHIFQRSFEKTPSFLRRRMSEQTVLPGERRHEHLAVVEELVRMARERGDVSA